MTELSDLTHNERILAKRIMECQVNQRYAGLMTKPNCRWCALIMDEVPTIDCCYKGRELFKVIEVGRDVEPTVYYRCDNNLERK